MEEDGKSVLPEQILNTGVDPFVASVADSCTVEACAPAASENRFAAVLNKARSGAGPAPESAAAIAVISELAEDDDGPSS